MEILFQAYTGSGIIEKCLFFSKYRIFNTFRNITII